MSLRYLPPVSVSVSVSVCAFKLGYPYIHVDAEKRGTATVSMHKRPFDERLCNLSVKLHKIEKCTGDNRLARSLARYYPVLARTPVSEKSTVADN